MFGDNSGDLKDHNVGAYSSAEAAEKYAENAERIGLSETEEKVLNEFFDPTAGAVLDVGCGAGRTTRRLAERGFDVTGIDVSERMIRTATDLYPDIQFQVADVVDLPFDDEVFEYVLFSAYGLDYVYPESDRLNALEEVHRILRPGGVFAFNTHNGWYNLPALLLARSRLKQLYLERGNLFRLTSPYKIAPHEYDAATYISNPRRQRRQLRESGFELVECVGKRRSPLKYVERGPYFVAKKPIG